MWNPRNFGLGSKTLVLLPPKKNPMVGGKGRKSAITTGFK
jgi:hypothetical protein